MCKILRINIAIFLLAILTVQAIPVAAQDSIGGSLVLDTPETDLFPTIGFHFEAIGAEGNFLTNLTTEDVSVVENGRPIQPDQLEKETAGLQLTVALNTSPAMASQSSGASQYEQLQQTLLEWIRTQPLKTEDDFSLATATGLQLIRSNSPSEWEKAVLDYQPDLLKAQPSLNSLAEALDLATDPMDQLMMKRAILYVTPVLPPEQLSTLPELTSRAQQTGVKVFVWLVAPSSSTPINPVDPLLQLALQTGGNFTQFYPPDQVPSLESQLAAIRQVYHVKYTSRIQKDGMQQLSVQVNMASQVLASSERVFSLNVQPPNPIFLSPPASVQRIWDSASGSSEAALAPDDVPLKIMVEFPDQHIRDLKRTRFYVDGQLAAEYTKEPFNQFTWNVKDLTESGTHRLRVEAVNSLNLTGSSLEVPIEVLVAEPPTPALLEHVSGRGAVAVAAVLLSGAALAFVLVRSEHKGPRIPKIRRPEKSSVTDPATLPGPVQQERARGRRLYEKPTWPRGAQANLAPGRLVSLNEQEQPVPGGAIPLVREEITFGSDPSRATQILKSPTVDGLHAQIYREKENTFILSDLGSVAGTWVNYAPITSHGVHLEHGDLIHIGRLLFRFELTNPNGSAVQEVKVQSLDEQE